MKPRLILSQSLQWKMNQSLVQSIHILQMTGSELIEHIKEAAEENPLIDEVVYDVDFSRFSSPAETAEEIHSSELTMYDQLKEQLYTLSVPQDMIPVIEFGIDSLDANGYLDIPLEEWADKCGRTIEETESALEKIQSLEPTGIGARNLQECLLLQLPHLEAFHSHLKDLLLHHLELVAEEDIESISDMYEVSEEQVIEWLDSIKHCHPRPGQLLGSKRVEYIVPEAAIFKEAEEWKISFFNWAKPKIKVSSLYDKIPSFGDKEAGGYLKGKKKELDALNQAIFYRGNTLEKVIRKIVEKQFLFLEHGDSKLQPLTLRELAEELDLHVSTISRAINSKYVQTEMGILPLKYFLQNGLYKEGGTPTASTAVRQVIREMILQEDKTKPLSDEAIRRKLEEEHGIHIARRTVMKYRNQLKIPSSMKRK